MAGATLAVGASAAALAIVFACSQQPSDAQDQDGPTPAETEEMDNDAMDMEIETDAAGSESLPSMMRATGDILGEDGNSIGDLNIIEGPNGLVLEVNIEPDSLTPGWHGMHIHQTGDCSDTGEYTNSGGHVGKIEGGHGLLLPDGPEPGDLPNLYVADDGSAHAEAFSDLVTLSEVLDADGGAFIIHTDRDDHMSQPIGGAGDRVACAVIE